MPWKDGSWGGSAAQQDRVSQPETGRLEANEGWALTIDVHNGHTHDAGDDNQGEAGCIIVHQQQPVDACLWASGQMSQGATDQATHPFPKYPGKCKAALPLPPHLHSYLAGKGDAQQEASNSHTQGHIGLFLQNPFIPHLIHNGSD